MHCGAIVPSELLVPEQALQSGVENLTPATAYLRQNRLLAALTRDELLRMQPHLEPTSMTDGQVLYRSGSASGHVYFPISSIASILYEMEDGACSEIALVGREGVLGVPIFMGGGSSPTRAVVLRAGYGYRVRARFLMDEFNRAGPLLRVLLRYTQALMTQIAQTAVCNRHHMLHQQLCRFLLSILDRQETNQLLLTQDLIAAMLGRRREGISEAARKLQQDGLIKCHRGHIEVVDRQRLEENACECYRVVKSEYERLLLQAEDASSAPAEMQ